MHTSTIVWNNKLRLAFSDVDETIAEVYMPAEPAMIRELSSFLSSGGKLFMVTGGSLKRVMTGIIDFIDPALRHDVLVSHCSGAEVWGFKATGELRDEPFYSIYEEIFSDDMKRTWRQIIDQLVSEFSLRTFPAQPKVDFWQKIGRNPLDIMLDDRGPQITMEVVNGTELTEQQLTELGYEVPLTNGKYDLRTVIKNRSEVLLRAAGIPITPHFGGNFALDFAVEGVSKTTSIQAVLKDPQVLATIGLSPEDVTNPDELEIWGDKFSIQNGGTDRYMSAALPYQVRSIDFRDEDPAELPDGYNIVFWDGSERLHRGLLEYLQSRHT